MRHFVRGFVFGLLVVFTATAVAQYSSKSGRAHGEFVVVTFSATPTYDASVSRNSKITLTGNVTSSTFVNVSFGGLYVFVLCQDATGLRTHIWPSNVKGALVITGTANQCSTQAVVCTDASNCYATAVGLNGL